MYKENWNMETLATRLYDTGRQSSWRFTSVCSAEHIGFQEQCTFFENQNYCYLHHDRKTFVSFLNESRVYIVKLFGQDDCIEIVKREGAERLKTREIVTSPTANMSQTRYKKCFAKFFTIELPNRLGSDVSIDIFSGHDSNENEL